MVTEKPRTRRTAPPPVRTTVKTTFEIDGNNHARLSALASRRGQTTGAFVLEAVLEALEGCVFYDYTKKSGLPKPSCHEGSAEAA